MVKDILFDDFYKGRKVFITGHTGFKGSWLLNWLHLLGAEIKGYALNPESENDLYNCIEGHTICESVISDIRSKERLKDEILKFEPDLIFHLAAQPLVRASYEIPSETFEVNVMGTANILDAVRFLEKPCSVIIITTDKVYENREWIHPYRENDNLGGYDPYSASKACAELVINSYRNSFFNPINYTNHNKAIASVRAGNVIGGGDWSKDRLFPDICRALGNHEKIIVRNPEAVRPWQHVLEPLAGYLKLGVGLYKDPIKFSQAFNFGPNADDVLSVEVMVKKAINLWGSGAYQIPKIETILHEAKILKLDISKAIDELNWKPRLNGYEAVKKTIDWYKIFFNDRNKISIYTRQQILDFITL